MPTKQQLESALFNADKAGDTQAATALANAIKSNEFEDTQEQSVMDDLNGALQRPAEFASGINKGLANILGLPVDATAGLLRLIGAQDETTTPLLSSDHIKSLLSDIGAIGEPSDTTGEVLDRVGQEVGANAVPAAAILNKARTAPAIVEPASNVVKGLVNDVVGAAKNNPAGFIAADTASAVVSGTGAATAQQLDPGNPVSEAIGSIAPVLTLGGVQSAIRGTARGGEQGRQLMKNNIKTFDEAGTTASVGQASEKDAIQGFETVISKLPGGGSAFVNKARQTAINLRSKVDEVTGKLSPKTGKETAGRVIEKGISGEGGFVQRFKTQTGELFNKVDEFIVPTRQTDVTNTRNILNELSAPIEGAENLSGILANNKMLDIAESFAKDAEVTGKLPYTALKQLRSKVGGLLSSSELISEAPKAELKRLYGALSQDMKVAAKESGEGAIKAFNRANNHFKSGLQRIDGLEKVVNRVDPEKIFRAVEKGDLTTIRQVMKSLKPDERQTVTASVIEQLGKATPGQQDALGEVFSSNTFLTNWNKLSNGSKQALFNGTKDLRHYRKDIDAIAETAQRIRDSSKALANPSGTAAQQSNLLGAGASIAGIYAGDLLIPGAVAATAVTSKSLSKLMTNPKFVNWLANSTKVPIERLPGYIARLNNVLKNESDQTKSAAADYLESLEQAQQSDQI